MFVVTMKFDRKKAVIIVVAVAIIIAAAVLLTGFSDRASETGLFSWGEKYKTDKDRVEFLKELGWEAEPEPTQSRKVIIPKEFDQVLTQYNELQLKQGYDLTDYAGTEVELYCYRIKNYKGQENVEATLFICSGKVIGGDIHSNAMDGFMHGLK